MEEWLLRCVDSGPPPVTELIEIEDGYEYRFWLEPPGVVVHFLALVHERRMIVKGFS